MKRLIRLLRAVALVVAYAHDVLRYRDDMLDQIAEPITVRHED